VYLSQRRQEVFCSLGGEDFIRMTGNGSRTPNPGADFEAARHDMVAHQISDRGIRSPRVLASMESVPRHLFVPDALARDAYADQPLPIGEGQTISQPFMVAAMADALALEGDEHVLEVGAGCGYQAAVLAQLAHDVTAVETQPALAASAREHVSRLGYSNIRIEEGDGSAGWLAGAPYDAILVTAAAPRVPQPLIDQLAEGGRLVIPVGPAEHQELLRIVKRDGRTTERSLYACRFVPLVGRYGWRRDSEDANRG
jgi:protein-L-isoaspartate(D-aspartate) O-methyltransferase